MIFPAGPAATRAAVEATQTPFPAEGQAHHFAGQTDDKGVYAREYRIPAGATLASHRHSYDHLSILASGRVRLTSNETVRYLHGPVAVVIAGGVEHGLFAVTDAVWYCIHPMSVAEPDAAADLIMAEADP